MMIRKEATKTTKNRGKAIAAGAISFSIFVGSMPAFAGMSNWSPEFLDCGSRGIVGMHTSTPNFGYMTHGYKSSLDTTTHRVSPYPTASFRSTGNWAKAKVRFTDTLGNVNWTGYCD